MGKFKKKQLRCNTGSWDKYFSPDNYRSGRWIFQDNSLITKNINQRLAIPGMAPMKADMIGMSSSLIHFLLTSYGFENMRASSYSLKEGIISSIIEKRRIRELSA